MLRAKCWLLAGFSLTALSGCGGEASVAVCIGSATFCSQAVNPVAQAGPDQTVASGSLVTLDGSGSTGNGNSYSWVQTGGPAVALSNANSAVARFMAPLVASAVTLSFRLTVVDNKQRAATDSTSVIVQP